MCGWWPPPPQRRKEKKKKKTNTKRKSWVVNTGEEDNNKFSVLAKHSQCELVKTLEMLLANENKSWVRSKRKVKVSRLEVLKINKNTAAHLTLMMMVIQSDSWASPSSLHSVFLIQSVSLPWLMSCPLVKDRPTLKEKEYQINGDRDRPQ